MRPHPGNAGLNPNNKPISASRSALLAWALFDWAGTPFPVLIVTFVFPAYFAEAVVGDPVRGQALWGYAAGCSALAIGIAGPIFGAAADAQGRNRSWLLGWMALCAAGSSLLWFVRPSQDFIAPALVLFGIANFGSALATAFNNAMLPVLASPWQAGRWSGWAWSLGCTGGLAALAVALVCFIRGSLLPHAADENIRIVGPFAACWFLAFGWPRLVWTPDMKRTSLGFAAAFGQGLSTLAATLKQLRTRPNILRFLIANMLYTDALVATFAIGGIYAAGAFRMSFADVALFAILLNLFAGAGAFAFAFVDHRIGSRRTIIVSLAGFIAAAMAAILARDARLFWAAGCALGLFSGPIQASSRSLMARLAPAGRETEFFGLFALSGRATAFVGPFLAGFVTSLSHSQRLGLASLITLLIAGAIALAGVAEPQPAQRSGGAAHT